MCRVDTWNLTMYQQSVPPGLHNFTEVVMFDFAGNEQTYDASELEAFNLGTVLDRYIALVSMHYSCTITCQQS